MSQQTSSLPFRTMIEWSSRYTSVVVAGMVLGLLLFYRSGALPLVLLGLVVFGGFALLRPHLALLFVPITMPLYLIPASISVPFIREQPFWFPLHEIVLLIVLGATCVHWLVTRGLERDFDFSQIQSQLPSLRAYIPHALFLVAGVIGVLIAVPEGQSAALREFRWVIVEPLIFLVLLKIHATSLDMPLTDTGSAVLPYGLVLLAFVLGGAVVGMVGMFQFVGLDLVWLFGEKTTAAFASNVVPLGGGLVRATSVFGHPNNLGLYLERVWPVAAAVVAVTLQSNHFSLRPWNWRMVFFALCCLLCLGGVAVSFSRGAWLGSIVAVIVLASPLLQQRMSSRSFPALAGLCLLVVVVGGLAFSIRGDPTTGSTDARILLWQEASTLIRQNPLGLGLDQFYYYHNPDFGRSIIDSSLIGTSEQYARHPHNLVLDTWIQVGPLGLIALVWVLVRFTRQALPVVNKPFTTSTSFLSLGVLAAMAAAVLHGLVDSFYFWPDLAFTFWMFIAIVERNQVEVEN